MNDYELFSEVIKKIHNGLTITFTKDNVAEGDHFLIFNNFRNKCVCKFRTNCVPYMVYFDNDEPMPLEECPTSFYHSILKNIN